MALPADVSTRTVHGAWLGMDGNPRGGHVTFTPTAEKLINPGTDTIITGTTITAHLGTDGEMTATLPCTDDEDLSGGPFSYLVTVTLGTDTPYAFWLDVPTSEDVLELADVTPILPADGGSNLVFSVNGQSGHVTLSPADIGAETSGAAATAVAAHVGASDPHPQYLTAAEGGAAYDALGSAAAAAAASLAKTANLDDLDDAADARTNLGLGGAAVLGVGTGSGTVAAGDDSRITGAAQKASNLGDLASAATARDNLGLGDSAVLDVGTTAGTVCAGDDARLSGGGGGGVPTSRLITAGTGLTGGGDLTADRTLAVAYGTSSTTACVGNDSRLSNTRAPTDHDHSVTGSGGLIAVPRAKFRFAGTEALAATVEETVTPTAQLYSKDGGPTWTTGPNITLPAFNADWDIKLRGVFQAGGANTGYRSLKLRRASDGQLITEAFTSGPGGTGWPVVAAAEDYEGLASQQFYVTATSELALNLAEWIVCFKLIKKT